MSWWHDDRTDRDYGQARGGSRRPERYNSHQEGHLRDHRRMKSPSRKDFHDGGAARRSAEEEEPTRRVYVHNLSYKTSWQDLKDYMRKAGTVEHVRVMEDRYGRSLGCAIVEYATREDAKRSIKELNDTTFEEGRSVLVREDRENGNRRNPPHTGGRGSHGGGSRSGGYNSRDRIGSTRDGGEGGPYRQVYGNGTSTGTGADGEFNTTLEGGNYEQTQDRFYNGYDRHEKSGQSGRYRSRSRSRTPRRRAGAAIRTKEQLDMELEGFQKSRKESKVSQGSNFGKKEPDTELTDIMP